MIGIQGAGWLTAEAYGRIRAGTCISYAERCELRQLGKTDGFFKYPIRNFGRFEPVTQQVCCVTALALADAGIDYAEDHRLDIGLIGTCANGCVPSNLRFFQDYMDGGRTLSRANLFIYTLPSSPLAEAAVHFKLQGALLYLSPADGGPSALTALAGGMLRRAEADFMLIYLFGEGAAICMVAGDGQHAVCALDDPGMFAGPGMDAKTLIKVFSTKRMAHEN